MKKLALENQQSNAPIQKHGRIQILKNHPQPMYENEEEMMVDTFEFGFGDSLEDITRTIFILPAKCEEQYQTSASYLEFG